MYLTNNYFVVNKIFCEKLYSWGISQNKNKHIPRSYKLHICIIVGYTLDWLTKWLTKWKHFQGEHIQWVTDGHTCLVLKLHGQTFNLEFHEHNVYSPCRWVWEELSWQWVALNPCIKKNRFRRSLGGTNIRC